MPFKVIRGHRFRYQSKAHMRLPKFLLVINTNLPPILHRFGDIAFDRSKIAVLLPLLGLTLLTEGFPWDALHSVDVNGWPRYQMPLKYCGKLEPPE